MATLDRAVKTEWEYFHRLLLRRFADLRRQKKFPETMLEEARIELALSRISWGNYQTCTKCGGPIDDKRLMAEPVTTTCEKCPEEDYWT